MGTTDARIVLDRPSCAATLPESSEKSESEMNRRWIGVWQELDPAASRIDRDEPSPMDGAGSNPDEEIPSVHRITV